MHLAPSQPVTILSARSDRRYIPHVAVLPNGVLRLNIGIGPDASFTPGFNYHSHDGGMTWTEAPRPCPRIETCTTFSDGSYYEIDDYFFQDPDDPEIYIGNAGFSADGRTFTHEYVKIHSPSSRPVTLRTLRQFGMNQHPWFPVINLANHDRPVTMDTVMIGGAHMSSIIELDSPQHLLASGFFRGVAGADKRAVMIFESNDGGRLWEERAIAMSPEGTPEGANESALVQLDNGDLYLLARTGSLMMEARSSDLGATWTDPAPVRMADTGEYLTGVFPIIRKMRRGGLICTFGRPKATFKSLEEAANHDYVDEWYGHCGKYVMVDPAGEAKAWQGRIDLHELEIAHQELMGVPERERLRVEDDGNVRERNSWEYLSLNEIEDDVFLITYDVQHFREHWNSWPVNGVRMVRVRVERT